jgi:hypothetical protein
MFSSYRFSALISSSVICSTLVSSTFSISPLKDIFSISEVDMSLLTVILKGDYCDNKSGYSQFLVSMLKRDSCSDSLDIVPVLRYDLGELKIFQNVTFHSLNIVTLHSFLE